MRENFLHHVWKYKKFEVVNLKTTHGESITIGTVGLHNHDSGPDFFNAKIYINDQLWAGNVEIHLKSSDWYLHRHENDPAYDNVILHVVYDHDVDIFRKDNSIIPTLEIKNYISSKLLNGYNNLFDKKDNWINCAKDFATVDNLIVDNWLERLYVERLEYKSELVSNLLTNSNNNWEAVLFKLITKSFGSKVNSDAFLSIAMSIDYSVIRKIQSNQTQLEALLFGQAGLLKSDHNDGHFLELARSYAYLKQKFQLSNDQVVPLQFFRLRPANFPTIRLSQLAGLYSRELNLFSKITEANTIEEFYKIFKVEVSSYWKTKYTFGNNSGTASKSSRKSVTKAFIDVLVVNSILPLKYYYAKQNGKDVNDSILRILRSIRSEKNSIVSAFNNLKKVSHSTLESQALIQLKTKYCDKNRCLYCAIGNALITK